MQSFIVLANNQEIHQPDLQHLKIEHTHQSHLNSKYSSEQSSLTSSADSAEHNEKDCHHCGHCHGSHMHWVHSTSALADEVLNSAFAFYYIELARTHIVDNKLRPPID
jgi:DNA-directed RNA polymerase subunit M/transcription elongation factor TFIIS